MIVVDFPNKLINVSYCISLLAMCLRVLALSKLDFSDYSRGFSESIITNDKEWQDIFIESESPYRYLQRAAESFAQGLTAANFMRIAVSPYCWCKKAITKAAAQLVR